MNPTIQAFFDESTFTVSYLVSDPQSRHSVIIDPVLNFDPKSARTSTRSADALLTAARSQDLSVEWILETHAHADHLSAAAFLKEQTGAKVAIGEHITEVQKVFKPLFGARDLACDGSSFDRLLKDGEVLKVGELQIEVLHTPGHTPACVSYKIGGSPCRSPGEFTVVLHRHCRILTGADGTRSHVHPIAYKRFNWG